MSFKSTRFESPANNVGPWPYFFAASMVREKGSVQSGIAPVRVDNRHAASIIP